MKDFLTGFEKQALFVMVPISTYKTYHPLKTDAAKKEYTREHISRGQIGGGAVGGLLGGSIGSMGMVHSGKAGLLGTGAGALAGGVGGAALGHYLGKRHGERAGRAGFGYHTSGDPITAVEKAKKYRELNKTEEEKAKDSGEKTAFWSGFEKRAAFVAPIVNAVKGFGARAMTNPTVVQGVSSARRAGQAVMQHPVGRTAVGGSLVGAGLGAMGGGLAAGQDPNRSIIGGVARGALGGAVGGAAAGAIGGTAMRMMR